MLPLRCVCDSTPTLGNGVVNPQATYETSGSSATAWEAAEEAMELHTAAHLGAVGEVGDLFCSYVPTGWPVFFL